MRIKTWIKYEESFIPPRCRKPRFVEREEYVDINLREAAVSDLSLAFMDSSFHGKGLIFSYKGKLWAEAGFPNPIWAEEHGFKTALEYLLYCREYCSDYFRNAYDREIKGLDTSREGVLKQARRDMVRYLLVDDTLYEQTAEPRYCIYTFGLGHNLGGTALSVCYKYSSSISRTCYFSALQGEEAVAEAERIALGRGDTESVPHFKPEIEVFMPELVKVKPRRRS